MNVYLATPHSYKDVLTMNVYLACGNGGNSACYYDIETLTNGAIKNENLPKGINNTKDGMNLYLAGLCAEKNRANANDDAKNKIFVLESFYYIQDWMIPYIENHWNFLLDSGAFTFMNDKKNAKGVDWEAYIKKYADFINKHDIKLFFELDIDSVVGIKEVERLRSKLERLTNKKCIPVWHKSRGLSYWLKMVKEYDYVAIGGIVTQEIKRNEYPVFSKLLKIAKDNNCKVHGLGFTNEKGMQRYKFHSVDSTAWIYGNRGGFLYKFNGKTIDKIQKPKGTRLKSKDVAIHNFKEWIKFQRYAVNNL
jgi:hypothetical protein